MACGQQIFLMTLNTQRILLFFVCASLAEKANNTNVQCNMYYDHQYNGIAADCSRRKLYTVPKGLPGDLVVLMLQRNEIHSLQGDVFCTYTDLKLLNLERNAISSLDGKTFSCLSQLQTLNLAHNFIENKTKAFPFGVFKPLTSLRTLLLNDSDWSGPGQFPPYIFDDIPKLRQLGISWWPDSSERYIFSKLHDLEELTIGGTPKCNLYHLNNDTFSALKHVPIRKMNFRCIVKTMENSPFWPFSKLTSLQFRTSYSSPISLQHLTSTFAPFVGRYMSLIDLNALQDIRRTSIKNTVLERKTASYLLSMCVDKIILSRNGIETVTPDFISHNSKFIQCIKYIDLSHNPVRGDAAAFFYMFRMSSLQVLDISYSRDRSTKFHDIFSLDETAHVTMKCPANLQQLLFRRSNAKLNVDLSFNLLNCTNLIKVDFAHIKKCVLRKVTGVPGLKHLDVSYCHIEESFFSSDFANITKHLVMKNASFAFDVMDSSLLFNMKSLKGLDMSSTKLSDARFKTFSRLQSVKKLILKDNKFRTIPTDIINMPSLDTLDLSNNDIRVISSESRSQLDVVAESRNITLLLEGNIFSCSCETLDFVSWLYTTNVNLDLDGNFSCVLKDGRRTYTKTFHANLLRHWRTCIGISLLLGTVIVYFIFLLSLLLSLVVLKYYPNIEQYVLYLTGYNVKLRPKRKDFKYDAYICYADCDYQWPCLCLRNEIQILDENMKLYLPDRDEPLGMPKAEAIIDALSSSWKVVIVISENTLIDDWSYFTLLSAVRLFSTHNVISNRIILLYKDATQAAKARVPEFLLNVLSENYIVTFEDTCQFWTHLFNLITSDDVLGYS